MQSLRGPAAVREESYPGSHWETGKADMVKTLKPEDLLLRKSKEILRETESA